MQYLKANEIEVTDRQRREITPKELIELKRSILGKGLLHAPVITLTATGTTRLVAGERRMRAMIELHEEGHEFTYNNQPVPAGHIPTVRISELNAADLAEAELEENILRMPLHWLEEAAAKARIHEMRQQAATAAGAAAPTVASTAQYILEKKNPAHTPTPSEIESARTSLTSAITVSKHKDDPEVRAAKSLQQAWKVILDREETQFRAMLAKGSSSKNTDLRVLKGNCVEVMRSLEPGSFDVILSDPPYGINADTMKNDSKHFYDDTPENALAIYHEIISQGFNLAKPRAVLMLWCDVEHFLPLRTYAAQQGWVPWRAPIIWQKGATGHAPWGKAGFIRTYEMLLFAVKGQRELYKNGGPDIITTQAIHGSVKVHAAEKPSAVLQYLLSRAAIEGDTVLDPCCGSGSIFEAAHKLNLKATGIELSDKYYDLALVRIGELQDGKASSLEQILEEDTEEDYIENPGDPEEADLF